MWRDNLNRKRIASSRNAPKPRLGCLTKMLAYKAEKAGCELVKVDPRETCQTCPECQAVARKTQTERTHRCWCGCSHTSMSALLIKRSTCLTACLVTKPRACANAWPMVAIASDAPVITHNVAPTRSSIRLACRS